MIEAETSTWVEIRDHVAAGRPIAVLAFGALEAHGEHLPLATDTIVAAEVARHLAVQLDAVLLPPIPYGATWGTAGYPGTISLSSASVAAIVVDIGRSLASFGADALVVVNGDWGNREPVQAAIDVLRAEGLRSMVLNYPGFADVAEAIRESPAAAPGLSHAEELETSMVLAVTPDLVHPDRYVVCYPDFPDEFGTVPMQLHPFSPSGVFGDPRPATAAKGRILIDAVIDASVREVRASLG